MSNGRVEEQEEEASELHFGAISDNQLNLTILSRVFAAFSQEKAESCLKAQGFAQQSKISHFLDLCVFFSLDVEDVVKL